VLGLLLLGLGLSVSMCLIEDRCARPTETARTRARFRGLAAVGATRLPPFTRAIPRIVMVQALVHAAREERKPDLAVLSGMLVMIAKTIHVLVSPATITNAACERSEALLRFSLDLPKLNLRNRVQVVSG
jgi:hypothetical protein